MVEQLRSKADEATIPMITGDLAEARRSTSVLTQGEMPGPRVTSQEFLADPENSALDLSTAVARCSEALGLQQAVVYLADVQQRQLVPLTDVSSALPVDGSLAGWTYRTQSLRVEESEAAGMTTWLPLVDGAERLGVLAVYSPVSLRRSRTLAALPAMMITSKRAYKDSLAGVLAQLDLASGVLRWTNCGHPAPQLIRDQRLLVDAMQRESDPGRRCSPRMSSLPSSGRWAGPVRAGPVLRRCGRGTRPSGRRPATCAEQMGDFPAACGIAVRGGAGPTS
jgi:hypothetical protein